MQSESAQEQLSKGNIRVTARADVTKTTLGNDPLLTFIANKVLPITVYRPSDENYNAVSVALQQATADVVAGKSAQSAAKTYQSTLEKAVGGADHVQTG
jgi:multiple sugar transport system substrate-binding protein